MQTVEEQLAEQGLRLAAEDESGWYVLVWVSSDETGKVWATDNEGAWNDAILTNPGDDLIETVKEARK